MIFPTQYHRIVSALVFLLASTTLPAQSPAGTAKGNNKATATAQSVQAAPTPEPRLEKIHSYLTFKGDPARSIVVNWWNPAAAGDGTVLYGPTAQYGASATVPAPTKFHHVELKNLIPGATYHYQIRSSDGTVGEDNTFTLPSENATEFSFAVSGDNRGNGQADDLTLYHPRHRAEYDHIASKQPAFTVNIGDLVNKGSLEGDWINFFNCEQNCLKRAPCLVAMGNHEVQGGGAWPADYYFYQLFAPAYPANGTPGSSRQPTALGMNYSFDYGNAHFVFLASYKISAASQVEWLDRDLAAARANPKIKWLFAAMHAPLYSWVEDHPADAKELAAWGPIFDKHHVDVVFAGHNHLYERSHAIAGNRVIAGDDPARGTIYITSGLGGGPFNGEAPGDPQYPFIAKSYSETTGCAFVQIRGAKLELQFINVRDQLIDSFSIAK